MRQFSVIIVGLCVMWLVGCASGERRDLVTLRGEPVTVQGDGPEVGERAPDFVAVGQDMKDRHLADWRGKTVIVSVVPSLDTPTCSKQTHRFNEEAGKLAGGGGGIAVVTVSMDLPFAQKRWCGANDAKNVTTVSDYKYRDFSDTWGLRIKESGLLARSIFVVDPAGQVTWKQIVPELTEEPDYESALIAAKRAAD